MTTGKDICEALDQLSKRASEHPGPPAPHESWIGYAISNLGKKCKKRIMVLYTLEDGTISCRSVDAQQAALDELRAVFAELHQLRGNQ